MKKADEAINLAQQRGSTATTVRGALRFLRANPSPASRIANGLAYVDYMTCEPGTKNYAASLLTTQRPVTHEDRYELWCERTGKWGPRAAEQYAAQLDAEICERVHGSITASYPFRASRSRWAGGGLHVSVVIDAHPGAGAVAQRVWSDNGKWSGTDTLCKFSITRQALFYFPSGRARGGEIILDAERVELDGQIVPRAFRVIIPVQSRGQSLRTATGYLIREHFVASEWSEPAFRRAQKRAAKARQASISALLAQRGKMREYRRIYVSRDDSVAAGNCATQTDAVAQSLFTQLNAAECAVRADILIAFRCDAFVQRAIAKAMQHTLAA